MSLTTSKFSPILSLHRDFLSPIPLSFLSVSDLRRLFSFSSFSLHSSSNLAVTPWTLRISLSISLSLSFLIFSRSAATLSRLSFSTLCLILLSQCSLAMFESDSTEEMAEESWRSAASFSSIHLRRISWSRFASEDRTFCSSSAWASASLLSSSDCHTLCESVSSPSLFLSFARFLAWSSCTSASLSLPATRTVVRMASYFFIAFSWFWTVLASISLWWATRKSRFLSSNWSSSFRQSCLCFSIILSTSGSRPLIVISRISLVFLSIHFSLLMASPSPQLAAASSISAPPSFLTFSAAAAVLSSTSLILPCSLLRLEASSCFLAVISSQTASLAPSSPLYLSACLLNSTLPLAAMSFCFSSPSATTLSIS
mmetsp:Transcript_23252/g.48268  ORF Transcript_23252/g.48268 Transcript_23252/m.48268 type:complete len:370 (-) Transcript_23252:758-1867(-)